MGYFIKDFSLCSCLGKLDLLRLSIDKKEFCVMQIFFSDKKKIDWRNVALTTRVKV